MGYLHLKGAVSISFPLFCSVLRHELFKGKFLAKKQEKGPSRVWRSLEAEQIWFGSVPAREQTFSTKAPWAHHCVWIKVLQWDLGRPSLNICLLLSSLLALPEYLEYRASRVCGWWLAVYVSLKESLCPLATKLLAAEGFQWEWVESTQPYSWYIRVL